MARGQEPFSQDLPVAELSEEGGSLSVLQKKHLGIRRRDFSSCVFKRQGDPGNEAWKLLTPPVRVWVLSRPRLQSSVWRRLGDLLQYYHMSRSEEGVWLLFSALVNCCNADQVEFQKDHCQSRNDIIATPVIFLNVSNSVVYTNSYDVDASLCRGSRHLKRDDWSVCVRVDFSDVKCSYFKSFCFSCFVVRDLLMSRLGQSSILEQRTSNSAVFQMDNSRVLEAQQKKKGKLFCVSTCFCFICLIQFYFCCLCLFSVHRPLDFGPVVHISSIFSLIFIHFVQSHFSFLSCLSLSNTLSLPPSFFHLSLTIGGMWAMLCMTIHKFQM